MSAEGAAAEDGPGASGATPGMPAGLGAALVVLAFLAVVAVLGEQDGNALGGGGREPAPASKAALSVYDGRSPSEPGNGSLRVLVELPRPPLAERDDLDEMGAAQQRAYVRSLEREGESLRSALGARGVELRDAVAYGRTWDGFAATVAVSDLASLSSLGVRALPVRRFYPATSEPVPGRREGARRAERHRPRRDPRHGRRAARLRRARPRRRALAGR